MAEIRRIQIKDIDPVKALADANRPSLGFNTRKKFEEAVQQQRGFVAIEGEQVIGFVIYRHRKADLQTTLSEICVHNNYRSRSVGGRLFSALIQDCCSKSRSFIQLKCPVDLPANEFYKKVGFELYTTEMGKKRHFNVWRFNIPSPGYSEA